MAVVRSRRSAADRESKQRDQQSARESANVHAGIGSSAGGPPPAAEPTLVAFCNFETTGDGADRASRRLVSGLHETSGVTRSALGRKRTLGPALEADLHE